MTAKYDFTIFFSISSSWQEETQNTIRHAFGADVSRFKRCLCMDLWSHTLVLLGWRWSHCSNYYCRLSFPTMAPMDAIGCSLLKYCCRRILGFHYCPWCGQVHYFCPFVCPVSWKTSFLDISQFDRGRWVFRIFLANLWLYLHRDDTFQGTIHILRT